jgi:hypothetical protein
MKFVELDWADEALAEMRDAKDLVRYEKAWIDYLHYLDRAWSKLRKYCNAHGIGQQHVSDVGNLRTNDALLQYLKQARNTDEHSISEVVAVEAAKTTITGGVGGGTIERGVIYGSGQTQGLVTSGNVEIKFHPEVLVVIPVMSRGVEYQVPTEHLGKPIATLLPHELARMGLDFYQDVAKKILLLPT